MVHGDSSKTAAFVSCKIITEAGALFLNSMALVRGANGLYLSFPSRKRDGQPVKGFEDYYYMERGLKELVQATAIEEFKKRCEELGLDAEKASAPLPPGSHGGGDDEDYQPQPRDFRPPREPQPRQPFSNESRPINGGYGGNRGGGFDRGAYGGGYDRGGYDRGGYGGGYDRGGYGANRGGSGGGYGGNRGGGSGGYGANRGGGYDRSAPPSRGGGYGSNNRGGNAYRGDDFGNRAGGYRGLPNDDRNSHGFPTGPNLANRPLSNRFNPYTGNDELQADKPGPGNEAPKRETQNDEGAE
jgi:DNA-binding cell septation regulator SpoVG